LEHLVDRNDALAFGSSGGKNLVELLVRQAFRGANVDKDLVESVDLHGTLNVTSIDGSLDEFFSETAGSLARKAVHNFIF
jgi:hypothetical protein